MPLEKRGNYAQYVLLLEEENNELSEIWRSS